MRFWRLAVTSTFLLLLAVVSTWPDASERTMASHGTWTLPFDLGVSLYVCQGYNGPISHQDADYFGLDLTANTPGSTACRPGNATAGYNVRSPIGGSVAWWDSPTGLLCVNSGDGLSVKVGHMNSSKTWAHGNAVIKDQVVGTVATAESPILNGGVAHIHVGAYAGNDCRSSIPLDTAHGTAMSGYDLYNTGGGNQWKGTVLTREPDDPLKATIISPHTGDAYCCTITLQVQASGGIGGPNRFEWGAYYSDSPGVTAPYWHSNFLQSTPANNWTVVWDVSQIPEQYIHVHGWICDNGGHCNNNLPGADNIAIDHTQPSATFISPGAGAASASGFQLQVVASDSFSGADHFDFGACYTDNPASVPPPPPPWPECWPPVGVGTPANNWSVFWDVSNVPQQTGAIVHGWIRDRAGNCNNSMAGVGDLVIGVSKGDANCSGKIDAVDALAVLRYVANLGGLCSNAQADVDCSGAVTSVDALRILRFVAKLQASFCSGPSPSPTPSPTPTPPPTPLPALIDDPERHGPSEYWLNFGIGYAGDMTATWNNGPCPYGPSVSPEGQDVNYAVWRPNLVAGSYRVCAYIPEDHAYTTNAIYEISHAGGTSPVAVNQQPLTGWTSLGVYTFNAGTGGYVRLGDWTGEPFATRQVGFDAIKWVPNGGSC